MRAVLLSGTTRPRRSPPHTVVRCVSYGTCWATSTPSRDCTTCSCTAGSRSSRPRSSGPARPSGLAVGGAAAGLVVLGKQFSSRTVALGSGVICAILPRATWAGIEARPYALSMMAAVWLTVLLVYAVRRDDAWAWLSYGDRPGDVDSARRLSRAVVFRPRRVHRCLPAQPNGVATVRVTSVLAGCAVTPFIVDGRRAGASDQLDLTDRPPDDRRCDDSAIFRAKPAVRTLVGAGGSGGYCVVAPQIRATDGVRSAAVDVGDRLAVIPTAVVVTWSALVHPIYTPRYLSFTAPAVALVLGMCIAAVARRAMGSRGCRRSFRRCRGAELCSGST